MVEWTYSPSQSPPARMQRRVVQWRTACQAEVAPDRPVVTFTFDHFPKSAINGADIIEKHGGRAGFYACTTLMNQRSPVMGEMFDAATPKHQAAVEIVKAQGVKPEIDPKKD